MRGRVFPLRHDSRHAPLRSALICGTQNVAALRVGRDRGVVFRFQEAKRNRFRAKCNNVLESNGREEK